MTQGGAVKTPHEIQTMPGFPLIINEGATLKHYRRLFLVTPFFTFLRNTALVMALVVTISMGISLRRHLLGRVDGRALMAAPPPIVVYVVLMDYYVSGLTAGATKG